MLNNSARQLIFYTLFALSTLLTLFILYRNITNTLAYTYVVAYALLLLIFLIYALFMVGIRLMKLERREVRTRLQTFALYFILFIVINLAIDFFIVSANKSLTNSLIIAFGLAGGITFFDLLFKKA